MPAEPVAKQPGSVNVDTPDTNEDKGCSASKRLTKNSPERSNVVMCTDENRGFA